MSSNLHNYDNFFTVTLSIENEIVIFILISTGPSALAGTGSKGGALIGLELQ